MKQLTDDRLAELRRQARDSDQLAERYWQWIFADLVIDEFCRINGITGEAQPSEQAKVQEAVELGSEWTPCMKLPVVVHVRKQRPGEQHVSTREGITPIKPDDLIMRGVAGEEYPIGRELFERTYTLDTTPPAQPAREWVGLTGQEVIHCMAAAKCFGTVKMSIERGPYDIDTPTKAADDFVLAIESKLHEKNAGLPAADSDPNAHWLTEAHMLCTDMGIPQGDINKRIKTLREKLAVPDDIPAILKKQAS